MPIHTNAGQRNGPTYQLDFIDVHGQPGVWVTQYFDSLEALARAAYAVYSRRASNDRWIYYDDYRPELTGRWVQLNLRAYSRRGRPLDVLALCHWGERLHTRWYGYAPRGYVRRQGPVPGIHKWRGGGSYRNCQAQAARRQALAWLPEEGEPPVRATRRANYLYDSWDGRARPTERCWKSQHKGRKAWQR